MRLSSTFARLPLFCARPAKSAGLEYDGDEADGCGVDAAQMDAVLATETDFRAPFSLLATAFQSKI